LVLSTHKFHIKINIFKLFLLVLLILLFDLLIKPYFYYANHVPYWSNISKDEYLAAEWIKQNSSHNGYILTDPSTGIVFRGLTIRNCSTAFIINGWTPSPDKNFTLRKLIYDFLKEEDPLIAICQLKMLPELPDFIVITTRTSSWIRWGGVNSTFCAPQGEVLMPFQGTDKFSTPFFTLCSSWETVKIYSINKTKLSQFWSSEQPSLERGTLEISR
jgi:hypothetical protein